MKTAFVFPGQGSQKVGMGKALFDGVAAARKVFEEADRALGFSLSSLCFEGPEEELRLTARTQPAILTVSVAALRALEERGIRADFVAGHSLGEYSALVAAEALRFEDAVKLVRSRGLFMQEAVPPGEGAMAALLGSNLETATALCAEVASLGVCSPANINSPSQIVIAGSRPAVERAVHLAREKGVKRAVMLAVSAPFHCSLMAPAAARLAALLEKVEILDLAVPLATNVDAELIVAGGAARDALRRQVAAPVQWCASIQRLIGEGVARFVEVGPGKVLSGLVRQICGECTVVNVDDPLSLDAAVAALR